MLGWLHSIARSHVDVALKHPVRLIANALGSPPPDVIEQAHGCGVPVAALAGTAEHARRHVAKGVDVVVAQGYEAGGHTGEIASMVLLPEVVDAVGEQVPVLAAGGIGSGRQIAAALALGAHGVWMGSAWLTTAEYTAGLAASATQRALLAATSADTVRSRIYSGKPARLLRTRWTRGVGGARRARSRCPCPCRTSWSARRTSASSARRTRRWCRCRWGRSSGRLNEVRPVAEVMADLLAELDAHPRPAAHPAAGRTGQPSGAHRRTSRRRTAELPGGGARLPGSGLRGPFIVGGGTACSEDRPRHGRPARSGVTARS